MKKNLLLVIILVSSCHLLSSCRTAYYGTMESFGVHKRDILVDRVKDANNAQIAAKDQFQDALTAFSSVIDFKGGKLEKKYNKLNKQYEKSEARAHQVRTKIVSIEQVAKDLFKEWHKELKQYSNQELRRASEQQYKATMRKYEQLIDRMNQAADKMDPVLSALHDQVLFLKHNLNSMAISSIQQEADKIEADISRLVKEMEASIAEADAFIQEMGFKK